MKNVITALVLLLLGGMTQAQKLVSKKVPATVKNAFVNAHPGATASWEREDGNYEANFKEGGKIISCVISKEGTILETETPIEESQLPVTAKTYMNQHYKGKKWKETAKIVKANGEVNYEVNTGKDILFDAHGNHLPKKEKKD